MPVRFTSPSLGGQRESFLEQGAWQVGVAFRRLYADKWFVGSQQNEAAAPFGRPLYLDINSLDLSLAYGVTHRLSLMLTLPFSYGTHSRFYADTSRHKVSALGIGDVSLVGSYWLRDPDGIPGGNIAVGLGVKTPAGNNQAEDDFFLPNDSITRRVVDQSIQLGDGGWGVMLQAVAYQRLSSRLSAYLVGSYLVSVRETTEVAAPLPGRHLAVPDVYSARLGVAYGLAPSLGLSGSLGGRIDGIPQWDLIGGRDLGFRRPGYTLYLDPTVALRHGSNEFTLSIPIRLHQDFQQSMLDKQVNFRGGGDLANYLLFAGYTHRF